MLSHLLDEWWECRPLPSISSFPLSRILKPIDFQKQSGSKAKCFNSNGRNPIPAPATHGVIVHYSDLTRRPLTVSQFPPHYTRPPEGFLRSAPPAAIWRPGGAARGQRRKIDRSFPCYRFRWALSFRISFRYIFLT